MITLLPRPRRREDLAGAPGKLLGTMISVTAATLSLPISSAPACANSRSGRSWVARSLRIGPP